MKNTRDNRLNTYNVIKELLEPPKKILYFRLFKPALFYRLLINEKLTILVVDDNLTITFYFDADGNNCFVNTLLSMDQYSLRDEFKNCLELKFKEFENLTENDLKFLNYYGQKPVEKANLIVEKYLPGYDVNIPSFKDLERVMETILFINQIIPKKAKLIEQNYNKNRFPLFVIDCEKDFSQIKYFTEFTDYPSWIIPKELSPVNKIFVDIYKNLSIGGDACLWFGFALKEGNKAYRKSVIYYKDLKTDEYLYAFVGCEPPKIKEYVYGFLDECFIKFGLPANILTNNMKIQRFLFRTLAKLKINIYYMYEYYDCDEEILSLIDNYKNFNGESDNLVS